jgi:hypothetical protein
MNFTAVFCRVRSSASSVEPSSRGGCYNAWGSYARQSMEASADAWARLRLGFAIRRTLQFWPTCFRKLYYIVSLTALAPFRA